MAKRILLPMALAALAFAGTVPRPAQDLAMKTPDGATVRLSQYKGKVVALVFILTHCSHCQTTVQELAKLQKEYGPRGFQALASAMEDMAILAVPDFVKRFQPGFPVGANLRDDVNVFLEHNPSYRMYAPQLVFLDRTGTIRAQYPGEDDFFKNQTNNMRAKIEELLANRK